MIVPLRAPARAPAPFVVRPLARLVQRVALAALVLAATFLLGADTARSNAALPVVKTFTQPDGSELELRVWGDEFANGWETVDGHSVVLNRATGFWEFAGRDAKGALVPSGRRVGRDTPAQEPHLRPGGNAQTEAIATRGGGPGAPRLAGRPDWAHGLTNVLVIMVQFPAGPNNTPPAVDATLTAPQMQANLFGQSATGPGNLADYYREVSLGALDLVGTVVGPYTVANNKDDYDDGPHNMFDLAAEAIALADPDVDFASFDNDGNGEVDFVVVCYAGPGPDNAEYSGANQNVNNLWPHSSRLDTPVSVDGGARSVRQYILCPELLDGAPTTRTIGVYAHEVAHQLGLPDLYDRDNSSYGVGMWCLMGAGDKVGLPPGSHSAGNCPAHLSAWCKYWLGWMEPTDLSGGNVAQEIPPAETEAFAVKLLPNPGGPNDWPGGSGEYFLIENRQLEGFDQGLVCPGLLVWHIDEARVDNQTEGHTAANHRLVDLEEAHGPPESLDLQPPYGNSGDYGDPFPGQSSNDFWSDITVPSALPYSGDSTDLRMSLPGGNSQGTIVARFGRVISFADVQAGLPGMVGGPVAWGDYDNDDDLDVLISGDAAVEYPPSVPMTRLYRNDGAAGFTAVATGFPDMTESAAAWGDYDNDGWLDVLVAGMVDSSGYGISRTRVFHNEGNGTFTDAHAGLPGVGSPALAWGDFDNDGDLDLVLTGSPRWPSDDWTLTRLYRNDGNGVFMDAGAGLPEIMYGSVAWCDYDKDGDLDLLLAGHGDYGRFTRLYRNDGHGVFTDVQAGLPGMSRGAVAWSDYDGDGDPDLLVAGLTDAGMIARIFRNQGGGAFTDIGADLIGFEPGSAAWGDYDNDGDPDLLLAGRYPTETGPIDITHLYRNDGHGGFKDAGIDLPSISASSVAWGDYDNDGDLDIMMSGAVGDSAGVTALYRSDSARVNRAPQAPWDLRVEGNGNAVGIRWRPATDWQTPPSRMTYNVRVGTTPGGEDVCPAMANGQSGYRRVAQPGNAQQDTFWTVKLPHPGTYYVGVQAVDGAFAGSRFISEVFHYTTDVADPRPPGSLSLAVEGAAPVRGEVRFRLGLPTRARTDLSVFDVAGRRVARLVTGECEAGTRTAVWRARADDATVRSGIYFARLESGGRVITRRVVLLE